MSTSHRYIIFGASGGIGTEVCKGLSANGAGIIAAGRNQEKLQKLAELTGADFSVVDATKSEQVNDCVEQAVEKYGRVDGIANCVGSLLLKPAHLTSDTDWQSVIDVNLNSAFYIVRAGVKAMMKTGGSIVLVSSAAAPFGLCQS